MSRTVELRANIIILRLVTAGFLGCEQCFELRDITLTYFIRIRRLTTVTKNPTVLV